ncbi:hypothetical protein [Kribbella sp. NPDC055071]
MVSKSHFKDLTDHVATALTKAHGTLTSVAGSLAASEIGVKIDGRLDDARRLRSGVRGVEAAEVARDVAQGAAVDPAVHNVKTTFRSYTVDAGDLAQRLGETVRQLNAERRDLGRSMGQLTQALKSMATVQDLSEVQTEQVNNLRVGAQYLKDVATDLDGRVGAATQQLEAARMAALGLEKATYPVDRNHQHSAALRRTSEVISNQVVQAGSTLAGAQAAIKQQQENLHGWAQYSVDTANTAAKAAAAPDLDKTMSVASNPTTPEQMVANGTASVDPRIAWSQPEQATNHERGS